MLVVVCFGYVVVVVVVVEAGSKKHLMRRPLSLETELVVLLHVPVRSASSGCVVK